MSLYKDKVYDVTEWLDVSFASFFVPSSSHVFHYSIVRSLGTSW